MKIGSAVLLTGEPEKGLLVDIHVDHAGYHVHATKPNGSEWVRVRGIMSERDARFAAKIICDEHCRKNNLSLYSLEWSSL